MNNKIKHMIDNQGLKVNFVIEKVGLAKSAFYAIMNGSSVPSLANARKISSALNKPLDEVFPNDVFTEEE